MTPRNIQITLCPLKFRLWKSLTKPECCMIFQGIFASVLQKLFVVLLLKLFPFVEVSRYIYVCVCVAFVFCELALQFP